MAPCLLHIRMPRYDTTVINVLLRIDLFRLIIQRIVEWIGMKDKYKVLYSLLNKNI